MVIRISAFQTLEKLKTDARSHPLNMNVHWAAVLADLAALTRHATSGQGTARLAYLSQRLTFRNRASYIYRTATLRYHPDVAFYIYIFFQQI
jgi:hypothetical protein